MIVLWVSDIRTLPNLMSRRFLCPHFFFLLSQFRVLHLVSDPFELIFIYLAMPSLGCGTWDLQLQHVGSRSLTRESNLGSLQWEHGLLASGPPGKSLHMNFRVSLSILLKKKIKATGIFVRNFVGSIDECQDSSSLY